MRPLKLIMSAFGPYAGEEVIDFTRLQEKNIFLVTGPTGAGKTTIFDAISYALFGEASGTSRDKDSLRSDFATLDTPTFVELEFELRGKKYSIRRYPQQERKKSRGDGGTVKSAEAQLILPSDEIVTRVSAVDDKISEILGINKNQFRQIVMLPQGEFRKLLESDSVEREGIFRKIFGTEAFDIIQRRLDDQKKQLYRKIATTCTQRDTHVKHIEAEDDEVLLKLINADNLNIIEIVDKTRELIEMDKEADKVLNENISASKGRQEFIQKKIIEGEEINRKFKDKAALAEQYTALNSRKKDFEDKKIMLELGRKALEVKQIEDSYEDAKNKLKEKQLQYETAVKSVTTCEESLGSLKDKLLMEESKKDERKTLGDSIASLKSQESKVRDFESKVLHLADLNKQLGVLESSLLKLKNELASGKAELEKAEKELAEAQNAETRLERLKKEKSDKEGIINDMRILYSGMKRHSDLAEEHRKKSLDFDSWDSGYKSFKAEYELKEEAFKRGQAGLLALDIKEGTECPVCGSTHHPNPAKLSEGMPTEAELQENKKKLEEMSRQREEKYAELSNLNGRMNSIKSDFPSQKEKLILGLGEKVITLGEKELLLFITQEGKRLGSEIKAVEEEQAKIQKLIDKKPELDKSVISLKAGIQDFETKLEDVNRKKTELYGMAKAEEKIIDDIKGEIPEELRSYNRFTARIKQLEDMLKEKEMSYETAQAAFNSAKEKLAALTADRDAKLNNSKEASKEAAALAKQLQQKIKAAGFTGCDQYFSLKMTDNAIKALDDEIQGYYQQLKSLKDRLEQAEKDTKELAPALVDELKESLNALVDRQTLIEHQEKALFSRINNNIKALREIENISELIKEDEAKYSVIGELASIANGDNSERITFERFVLAAYFDEIIDAANVRLGKMAGGRFVLRRKEEKGKGRKQEGLELEVFDNYTGKARHVKTLSGGESFKASLALALGLADVVQSHAGGISLDTMFVDEGFGTLDPESLDTAIQCLIDLQADGRLVGIISHVPELKERIDVRLEITPAKEGSRARFIV